MMETMTFIDKSTWGDGPWQTEPDRAEWRESISDLPCLALRHPRNGNWCGYAAVPPGHPWHGKNMHQLEDLSCHGGITFAGRCMPHIGTGGERELHEVVCHVPRPGEPDNVWWIGFDCSHAWDISPAREARERALGESDPSYKVFLRDPDDGHFPRYTYWCLEYVRANCEHIARCAAALKYAKPVPWKIAR